MFPNVPNYVRLDLVDLVTNTFLYHLFGYYMRCVLCSAWKRTTRPVHITTLLVPEIIDPVFAKTSQNARFLLSENERFGLVFMKTGSINSGTVCVLS